MQTSNKEIQSLVLAIASSARLALQDRCVAVYIMGSLARGGFSETASDIDIGLLLEDPLQAGDEKTIDALVAQSAGKHSSVKNKVSVFQGSVNSINGTIGDIQYSPFDRRDLIDHAVIIDGTDIRVKLIRPAKKELEIEGVEIALGTFTNEKKICEFNNPDLLLAGGDSYIAKAILFPARYLYIAGTGKTAGHDVSSRYYTEHYKGDDAELVNTAYKLRHKPAPGSSTKSSSEFASLLRKGLTPLYHNFIDTYIPLMKNYGEQDLASRLGNWKQAIGGEDHT